LWAESPKSTLAEWLNSLRASGDIEKYFLRRKGRDVVWRAVENPRRHRPPQADGAARDRHVAFDQ